MVCKVCGAKLQEGSAICELCGSPVGDSEIKSDYDPFTENNNSSGQWQEQFDNNAVKYNSSEKTTDNSKMNISFNPKIFAIVAVAILVIAITAILLINIGKNKSFVNNNSDYSIFDNSNIEKACIASADISQVEPVIQNDMTCAVKSELVISFNVLLRNESII